MALNLQHQTATEFATRYWTAVRRAYNASDDTDEKRRREAKQRYAHLLWWLVERITAGDITDNQARLSFNAVFERSLTSTQWTTLRTTRINPVHSRWAQLLAEGEL